MEKKPFGTMNRGTVHKWERVSIVFGHGCMKNVSTVQRQECVVTNRGVRKKEP